MIEKETIIASCTFGPTYRDRLKFQIEEAASLGYDKVMKHFIITDRVEDFVGLDKKLQSMIIDVVDIEDMRKDDEFSKMYEPLPEEKVDEEIHAQQLRYNSDQRRLLFSYNLRRYSFKGMAERGISKFLLIDNDVKVNYDNIFKNNISEEDFWNVFNIPSNCIKGCGYETLKWSPEMGEDNTIRLVWSRSMGNRDSMLALQACSVVAYQYYLETQNLQKFNIIDKLEVLEGGLRLYNFENAEKLNQYFNTMNRVCKIFLENDNLRNCNLAGGYILCDYLPTSLTNIIENISAQHFPGHMFEFRNFFEDRFWGPPYIYHPLCEGEPKHFLPAKNRKEFYEINAKMITAMKSTNQWPYISWSVI